MAVKTKNFASNTQSRNYALFTQPDVRHRIHSRPPLIPILCMMKVVYTRTSQFLNMRFNIFLISTPVLHLFSTQIYKHNRPTVPISVSHLMHAVCPCHLFDIFFGCIELWRVGNIKFSWPIFSPSFLLATNIRQLNLWLCSSNNITFLFKLHKIQKHVIQFTHSMKMMGYYSLFIPNWLREFSVETLTILICWLVGEEDPNTPTYNGT